MNLNNKNICINFDTLDLVKELRYERQIRREFSEKPVTVCTIDNKRKRRSVGFDNWCLRIFKKK